MKTIVRCNGSPYPDNKVHGANMGPTWGRQDPGGPHVGHVNLAIWAHLDKEKRSYFHERPQ